MRLLTPDGDEIIGTLDTIPGVALASSFDEKGAPEYDGETELDWDNQTTVKRGGKIVYVTENGKEFTLDQLTIAPDEGDEDDDDNENGED